MKKVFKFFKIILILALLVFLLIRLNYVLRDKEYASVQDNFANLEKDSVDIVFVGASHCFCSIDPYMIKEKTGKEVFVLSTSAQTVPESYYAVMEAIELQHPKTIYMEVQYCVNDFTIVMPHSFFDGMPNCKAKYLGIKDLIPKDEQSSFYINLGAYHTRWKNLKEKDYQSNLTAPMGEYVSNDVIYQQPFPIVPMEETEQMPEISRKYLDQIIELCRENDVELVLFCAPYGMLYVDEDQEKLLCSQQKILNSIYDIAEENGLEYYDMFHEMDKIGIDEATDWKDTQHFNASGQQKFTAYMLKKGYIR